MKSSRVGKGWGLYVLRLLKQDEQERADKEATQHQRYNKRNKRACTKAQKITNWQGRTRWDGKHWVPSEGKPNLKPYGEQEAQGDEGS